MKIGDILDTIEVKRKRKENSTTHLSERYFCKPMTKNDLESEAN